MRGKKRLVLIFSAIAGLVLLFSQCMETDKSNGDDLSVSDTTFAAEKTCIQCHKNTYDTFKQDPHFNTSRPIKDFDLFAGNSAHTNTYVFDQHLEMAIEKRDSGMYQAVYIDGHEQFAKRFDVAIGSGKNAITYASWKSSNLTQLQLSYFTKINSWANSPGYPDKRIYARIIEMRCLECHGSHAALKETSASSTADPRDINKSSVVYGINCQRCHGPSAQHVEFHVKNPNEKVAKYVARYQELSRKHQVDACAVCHSGNDKVALKTTFGFKPGDDIESYFESAAQDVSAPDVHGQQNEMLASSQCYIKSKDLTCNSCHSIHGTKTEGLTPYSKKCISCHATPKHSENTLKNAMVKTNCIDCHMPMQSSKAISYKLASESKVTDYYLRTHKIAVYP
ncbi:MAG: hypothetical protein EOO92_06385 [Pedobacter sp.]|nr:MAG: hypothetical protein EOO92_06385 [Pedobacter sp.]